MTTPIVNQFSFRGRDDSQTLNSATFTYAENTDWSQDVDTTFRIRIGVEETANGAYGLSAQIEYNHESAGWVAVTTTSSVVIAVTSAQFTDGDACSTSLLTGSVEAFDASGTGSEDGLAQNVPIKLEYCENEFALQIVSGDVANNDTIQLRVTDTGVALDTYDNGGGAGSSIATLTVVEAAATQVPPVIMARQLA